MAYVFTKDGNWTRQSLIAVLDRVGIATLIWLFVVATLGFSFGATLLAAQSANRTEAERAQAGIEFKLADELDELSRISSDFSHWDEAVVNLAEQLEPDWADANIGGYMHRQHNVDATFVMDPDAGMVIGFVDGVPVEAGPDGPELVLLRTLIAAASIEDDNPIPAHGALILAGVPHLAAASPILGFTEAGRQMPGSGKRTLILMRRIDDRMIERIKRHVFVPKVDVVLPHDAASAPGLDKPASPLGGLITEQKIVIGLSGADGDRVAQLHVVPHGPGWRLISRVATPGLLLGLTLAGMAAMIIGSFRRVQRQRDAQNRLLLKAQQASQAKSEFLTNMSHELRTPLNAILGFAEVIRYRHFGDRALDRYSDYAADIHASGQHLLAIINDILDMAKIEAGRQELHITECDLTSIVEATVGLMRQQAEQAGLIIQTTLPEALRPILIDERLIRQILFNLLSNAIKFTASGGHITVLVSGGPEGATITVSDTGIGIRAEHLPLVLAPFGQVGSTFTRSKGGTGLGLPLCKAIAELHGGQMRIDSEPGRGTTVTVELPFQAQPGPTRYCPFERPLCSMTAAHDGR